MTGHLVKHSLGPRAAIANSFGTTAVAATSSARTGFSAGIYIPHNSLNDAMERIVDGFMQSRSATGWARTVHDRLQTSPGSAGIGGSTAALYNSFNQTMAGVKAAATAALDQNLGIQEADYNYWALPYYGIESVGVGPQESV
jgi:hypothetical protein